MNALRRLVVDWLFGFGEPVENDYVPPVATKPEPVAPLLIVTTAPTVVEVPQPTSTEKCIVCQLLLGKSPSDFFCSDACQRAWDGRQADLLPSTVQLPDGTLLNSTRRVG